MSSRAPLTNLAILPLDRVTTTFELPGHRVVRNLGVVRGIVVRSRNIVGTFVAGLQTLFGGNITLWTEMCEQARREAFELMALHARQIGANAGHRRALRRDRDLRRGDRGALLRQRGGRRAGVTQRRRSQFQAAAAPTSTAGASERNPPGPTTAVNTAA